MDELLQIPLGKGVKVISRHPCGLCALSKPEGVMTVPNTSSDYGKSLLKAKFDKKKEAFVWMNEAQEQIYFYICHRLDSPTSGIILGSLELSVALSVRNAFKQKTVGKTYLAAVSGIPRQKSGYWKDTLRTEQKGGSVRSKVGGTRGDPAQTKWLIKKTLPADRMSLLELSPISGKTHQLRVQTSSRSLPILGDRTYGDFKLNTRFKKQYKINRLMLHAWRINLDFQYEGQAIHFQAEAKAPPSFKQLFDI